jgi:CBS domain-containing protein
MMQNPIETLLSQSSTDLWCIASDATILEAARRMDEHGVGTLIVVEGNRAAGMLEERDVVCRIVAHGVPPEDARVSDVMKCVQMVQLDDSVEHAATIAAASGYRQVLVLDGNLVVGLIAAKTLTSSMIRDQALQISDLTSYITGRSGGVSLAIAERPGVGVSGTERNTPKMTVTCASCGLEDDQIDRESGVALCRVCSDAAHKQGMH